MDVFCGDGLLHHFAYTEGSVARRIEVAGRGVQRSLSGFPSLDFLHLNLRESYLSLLIHFGDVDDVTDGGDDCDVYASEWMS